MEETKTAKEMLAHYGGPRVRVSPMPPRSSFGAGEFAAVQRVYERCKQTGTDFGYQDFFEKEYTDAFVKSLGVDGYADAVATGSAALYVGIAALRLPAGSHVLVSSITDPGTINSIILNNLVPVVVDTMPGSYNIGAEQVESRLTDKTKAVLVVHAAGKPAPVDEIVKITKRLGISLIEDCSQSHGATIGGKKVGTIGEIAMFSTMYRKAHTTGGCGGVIFTQDKDLYHMVRAFADRGKPFWSSGFNDRDPRQFLFPALNFNLDELSCAIGSASLARLEDTRVKRVRFLQKMCDALEENSHICKLMPVSETDSPFFQPVFVDVERITCSKLEFAGAVFNEGIPINANYQYVVCEWQFVKPYLSDAFDCPNARDVRDRSFNLLLNENYGDQEVLDITNAILKVERYFGK